MCIISFLPYPLECELYENGDVLCSFLYSLDLKQYLI